MKKFDLANWWITLLAIIIIAIVIAILMSGCVMTGYRVTDPNLNVTVSGWYMRAGDQKMGGLKAKLPGGGEVNLDSQESTAQALADLAVTAKNLSGVVK